tara:strand:- start:85 stop:207 length:123 start_codon:yes stop_codon:yes gene_type:complete
MANDYASMALVSIAFLMRSLINRFQRLIFGQACDATDGIY